MQVAIIDYGMGNIGSVRNALHALGFKGMITNKQDEIAQATHLILPGVGAFGDGMNNLYERGLVDVLTREVMERKKPALGICLGMQLLAEVGEEGGEHVGLGWVKGRVRRFQVDERAFRIPHVGWNDVVTCSGSTLFAGIGSPTFYFVHSYFLVPENSDIVAGTCDYGETFAASIEQQNVYGVQFHPEKSQTSGLTLLKNFLSVTS